MKIIASTTTGFITEISTGELAELLGYYSNYTTGFKQPVLGDTVNISQMYRQLYYLSGKKELLNSVAKDLRSLADQLEIKNPIISKALEELKWH